MEVAAVAYQPVNSHLEEHFHHINTEAHRADDEFCYILCRSSLRFRAGPRVDDGIDDDEREREDRRQQSIAPLAIRALRQSSQAQSKAATASGRDDGIRILMLITKTHLHFEQASHLVSARLLLLRGPTQRLDRVHRHPPALVRLLHGFALAPQSAKSSTRVRQKEIEKKN